MQAKVGTLRLTRNEKVKGSIPLGGSNSHNEVSHPVKHGCSAGCSNNRCDFFGAGTSSNRSRTIETMNTTDTIDITVARTSATVVDAVGNDGLTNGQRDFLASRYAERSAILRRPSAAQRETLRALMQRRAS